MWRFLRWLIVKFGVSQKLIDDVRYRLTVLKADKVGSHQLILIHHLIDGFTITNNSPSVGYIAWANLHIVYQGTDYAINDGNSNKKFLWWDYSLSTSTLQATDTLPSITDDDIIIFLNKNGIHVTVPTTTAFDGSIIVSESILAEALSANCVTSEKIYSGAVIAAKIAAGAVIAEKIDALAVTTAKIAAGAVEAGKIAAGAIVAEKIGAGAVTTAKLDALAVTADKIAALTITAAKIATGTITASEINVADFINLPSDEDLVGYWSFDEGNGILAVDGSGNDNNGTLYPTPVPINACDATTDWTGAALSIDTSDKMEGTGSLKNTIASPVVDVYYPTIYEPAGSWDWSAKKHKLFWLKSDRANIDFATVRFFIHDTSANWRYWNLTFSAGEWTACKFLLSTGTDESETPPDLALIANTRVVFQAADDTPFWKKIDDVRIDDRPQWVDGMVGKALDYDGMDDYVNCGDDASLSPENITVVARFKLDTLGIVQVIASHYWWGKWGRLEVDASNRLCWTWVESDETARTLYSSALSIDTMYSAAITFDKATTTAKLYLNGQEVDTETAADIERSIHQWVYIGVRREVEYGDYFHGLIDEVRIYRGMLTEAELKALHLYPAGNKAVRISGGQIAADTILTDQLAAGAVTADILAANSVIAAKIATNAIYADNIVAGEVTGVKIAAGAIATEKLAADSVTAPKINVVGLDGETGRIIVVDATDADEITEGINAHALTLIEAGKILISGETDLSDWRHDIDATLIDGGKIYTQSITAAQIAAGTITADEIAAGTITADEIFAGTITADEIKVGAITLDRLATYLSEPFDGLTTGAIHGQGDYIWAGTWVTDADADTSAEVVVESGEDKMLRLTDNGVGHVHTTLTIDAGSEVRVCSFSIKMRQSATDRNGWIYFKMGETPLWGINFRSNGQISYWDGGQYFDLQAYVANTWYEIKVYWDLVQGGISILINNILRKHTDIATETYIDQLTFSTGSADTGYTIDFDDLEINNLIGWGSMFTAHALSHENGGDDEIHHDDLDGFLASEHFTQAAITTVGTIGTGVWQGTAIANTYIVGINQNLLTTSSPTLDDLTISNPVNIYALSHNSFADYAANRHVVLPGTIAAVLSDHDLAAHTGLGLFDQHSDVDHNQTTNYAANQHVVLPGTIANVLSNHTLAVHNALNITQLGTVGTGVWQGTAIANAYIAGINQNLLTTSSPTLVTAKLTALTDGYVPYHVSDAAGLANSPIRLSGTKVGIGISPVAKLHVDATATAWDAATGLAIFQDNNDRQIVIGGMGLFRRDIDANADLRINYLGYNGGVTQFRDLDIYDGKQNKIASFDGSVPSFEVLGTLKATTWYLNLGGLQDVTLGDLEEGETLAYSQANGGQWIDAWGVEYDNPRLVWKMYTDFFSAGVDSNDPWVGALFGGSIIAQAGTSNHPGIVRFTVDAANAGSRFMTATNCIRIAGAEHSEFCFKTGSPMVNIRVRLGFQDSTIATAPTDGVWIDITGATLTGKTMNNGAPSTTGTSWALAASTWYRAKLAVNSDADEVYFFLYSAAGTILWNNGGVPLTTNIPTAAGRETGHGIVMYVATSVARSFDVDMMIATRAGYITR